MMKTLNIFFLLDQFLGFSGSVREVQLTTILPSSSIVLFLGPVGPFVKSVPVLLTGWLMTEAGTEFRDAIWVKEGPSTSSEESESSTAVSETTCSPSLASDLSFPISKSRSRSSKNSFVCLSSFKCACSGSFTSSSFFSSSLIFDGCGGEESSRGTAVGF